MLFFLALSAAWAYGIATLGFALAHSLALGILTFAFSPGIIIIFLRGDLSESIAWTILIVMNVLYYELIYRLVLDLRLRAKNKSADVPEQTPNKV
jgi:hypothetical protein